MNKRGKYAGLIIVAIILILLLLFVVIVFVFKVDLFNTKHKERELTYQTFLIKVYDKESGSPLNSRVYIYFSNGTLIYNLSSQSGVYEKINLTIDETYITTQRTCWTNKFLFFKWNTCGEKKLDNPIAYSSYCLLSQSNNYYNQHSCFNLTKVSPYLHEIELTPSGEIQVVSPAYLIDGDSTETYQFITYISNSNGEFHNGVICLDYSIGIVKAWIVKQEIPKSSFPDEKFKRCYLMDKNLVTNESYDFSIFYKSNPLYTNDFIDIVVYDRDYINNKLEYFDNKLDLGSQTQELMVIKNGN